MDTIEAIETKLKKEKKIVYSFSLENENFEAHFNYGKKPDLILLHNGTQIGVVNKRGDKVPFSVNTEKAPINITAWMESDISTWLFGRKGVGIQVDGKPVQHTLADPNTHIKGGKTGLLLLLFIFALKSVVQIITGDKGTAVIYFVPILLLILLALMYKKWLTFALIAEAVLSVLEFADYITAVLGNIKNGGSPITVIFWIAFRVGVFAYLFDAFKWKRKAGVKAETQNVLKQQQSN